jgi:hypothetical protein
LDHYQASDTYKAYLRRIGEAQMHRFRRNELKNLARRKGYRVKRVYTPHAGWIYRIERLPLRGARYRCKDYEYCNTENLTARQRVYLDLSQKPDASSGRYTLNL